MSVTDCDVVVIGSGVAGSLVAVKLAQAGLAVTVLEAGRRPDRATAVRNYAAATKKGLLAPYADQENDRYANSPQKYDPVDDKHDAFQSTYLRRVGGSTWHWQGHTPRLIPADFRMFSQYGVAVDWPLTYDDLEPYYVLAETELGVSGDHTEWNHVHGAFRSQPFPMPPIWPSYADLQVTSRLGNFEVDGRPVVVRAVPQARNSRPYQGRPACAGNSTCIPICPIGAKYDATVHVDRATTAGAALVDRTVATKLLLSADKKHIEGVVAATWGQEPVTYRARRYVVAAHTIESARLLLASSLGDLRPQIGKNLMDHPTGAVVGLAPEAWYTFRGPPATSGVDEWRDGDERSRGAAWKLSLGNDGFGRFADHTPEARVRSWLDAGVFGTALRQQIEAEVPRWYRISWAAEQLPSMDNRVELKPDGDIRLVYMVDDYTRGVFPAIRTTIAKIFERIGVSHIEMAKRPRDFGGSGHILGTCRMGLDASSSVVDAHGRFHGIDDLYVVGGSTFPTIGTANPTLTIAALALRTAQAIAQELSA